MDKQNQNEKQNQDKDKVAVEGENQSSSLPTSEELELQLRSQQEKNLRLLAEMENARKRMQKDKHETTRFAVENVIAEFLSPLDNFENALSFANQASEEVQNWAKGFDMILNQFKTILSDHNIDVFQSEGNLFDPHFHEVIEVEVTEKHKDGTIIQEFARGYKCGDRILRPAKVKVTKKPVKEDEVKKMTKEEIQLEGEK